MQTKQFVITPYDNDIASTVPAGMVLISVEYDRAIRVVGNVGGIESYHFVQGALEDDETLVTVTYGTAAEACALWGVNFVAANDDEAPNFSTEPLFVSRPRYISAAWLQWEAREVAALSA